MRMGMPIVFLHGLGGASSIDYADLAKSLALQRRCLLIDLPGTADTPLLQDDDLSITGLAQHVVGRLQAEGLSQAIIFGHSMGGSVALSLAAGWPSMVNAVVLTESNLDPGGGTWSRSIANMSETEFAAHGYDELIAEQHRDCPSWAHTVTLSSPLALHREATSLVEGTNPTWRATLYGLTCPRFYIFGDHNLPDPDADELPRHGVEVLTVNNAGHNMVYDNPKGFADTVLHCLRNLVSSHRS